MVIKECERCAKRKRMTSFQRRFCDACRLEKERKRSRIKAAEFRRKYPEKAKLELAIWRAKNQEHIKKYRQKRKYEDAENWKKWIAKPGNRKRRNEAQRNWRINNKNKMKIYSQNSKNRHKKWRDSNKDKIKKSSYKVRYGDLWEVAILAREIEKLNWKRN